MGVATGAGIRRTRLSDRHTETVASTEGVNLAVTFVGQWLGHLPDQPPELLIAEARRERRRAPLRVRRNRQSRKAGGQDQQGNDDPTRKNCHRTLPRLVMLAYV